MNRLTTDIWVSQANIDRFRGQIQAQRDPARRSALAGLLEQEAAKLRELMWVQEFRRRLLRVLADRALLPVIEGLLDDAIAIAGADAGNVQVADPTSEQLHIVASRGHPPAFLDFFAIVECGGESACGRSMLTGDKVLVEDVETSPIYLGKESGRVMRESGSAAVQSIPLRIRGLYPVGMLSTHWRMPGRPDNERQRALDLRIGEALDELRLKGV